MRCLAYIRNTKDTTILLIMIHNISLSQLPAQRERVLWLNFAQKESLGVRSFAPARRNLPPDLRNKSLGVRSLRRFGGVWRWLTVGGRGGR